MLTKEAWNAFLKTLEEPPPNTVFVLATTEPHKVMPTIVDRCQRFDFQRPSLEQIAEVVDRVAAAESIEIDDGRRRLDRPLRDRQLPRRARHARPARRLRRQRDRDRRRARGARRRRRRAALRRRRRDRRRGRPRRPRGRSTRWPARAATRPGSPATCVAHLRQLLVIGTTGEVPDALPRRPRAARPARRAGRPPRRGRPDPRDRRALDGASPTIREGDEPRMTVEVALLRLARPELDPSRGGPAQRIERLERAPEAGRCAGRPPAPRRARRDVARAERRTPAPRPRSARPRSPRPPRRPPSPRSRRAPSPPPRRSASAAEEVASDARAQVSATAQAAAGALDLDRVAGLWPAVLDQMRQSGSGLLSAALFEARPVAVDAERVGPRGRLPAQRRLQQAQGRGEGEPRAGRRRGPRRSSARRCGPSTCCSTASPRTSRPTPSAERRADERGRSVRPLRQRVRRRGRARRCPERSDAGERREEMS